MFEIVIVVLVFTVFLIFSLKQGRKFKVKQSTRKSLYFMPFLLIDETIECKGIRLIKNDGQHEDLMPVMFKKHSGIFIELVDVFQSGNDYDEHIRIKIYNAIEILKFSYYTIYTPTGDGYPRFLSESTFEIFSIIEGSQDKSFEHKIPITNGISNFLMNLDDYYKHKYILGFRHSIKITENALIYFKYIYNDCSNNENQLSILKLYNKCLRITDTNDCFDKIIFARASIDTIVKTQEPIVKKTNYVEIFINKSETFISNYQDINSKLLNFYNNHVVNDNGLDKAKQNLSNYLRSLASARHNLVHQNKIDLDFMTIEVYIAWFPLFFLIIFFEDKMTKKDIIKLILFLKLLQLDFSQWNKKDNKNYSKITCLEVYAQYTRTITTQLDKNNIEVVSACLEEFNSCFENSVL